MVHSREGTNLERARAEHFCQQDAGSPQPPWPPLRREGDVEQKLVEKPLMRFNDPARNFHDGAVWAFGQKGRPLLLAALERYEGNWAWELASLSTAENAVEFQGDWKWTPEKPGLVLSC